MKASVTLGRPFGITIGAHWSLFAFGLLAAWSLASGFESGLPGYGTATYWAVSVAVVVLFFGGLIIHELAHALVARRHGLEVETITLWILGGMATALEGPGHGQGGAADRGRRTAGQPRCGVAHVRRGSRRVGPHRCPRADLRSGAGWPSPPPCSPCSTCCRLARWTAAASSPPSSGCARRTRREPPMAAAQVSTVVGWLLVAAGAWLLFAFGRVQRRVVRAHRLDRGRRLDRRSPARPLAHRAARPALPRRDGAAAAEHPGGDDRPRPRARPGQRGAGAAARREGCGWRRRRRAVDLRCQPGRLHPPGHPGRRSGQAAGRDGRRRPGRRRERGALRRRAAVAGARAGRRRHASSARSVRTSCRAGPPTTTSPVGRRRAAPGRRATVPVPLTTTRRAVTPGSTATRTASRRARRCPRRGPRTGSRRDRPGRQAATRLGGRRRPPMWRSQFRLTDGKMWPPGVPVAPRRTILAVT